MEWVNQVFTWQFLLLTFPKHKLSVLDMLRNSSNKNPIGQEWMRHDKALLVFKITEPIILISYFITSNEQFCYFLWELPMDMTWPITPVRAFCKYSRAQQLAQRNVFIWPWTFLYIPQLNHARWNFPLPLKQYIVGGTPGMLKLAITSKM